MITYLVCGGEGTGWEWMGGEELEKEEKARPWKALLPRPRSLSFIVTATEGQHKV